MVHLHVIDHEIVDFFGIDDSADSGEQFLQKGLFHRVEKRDFFVHRQIGIIGVVPFGVE